MGGTRQAASCFKIGVPPAGGSTFVGSEQHAFWQVVVGWQVYLARCVILCDIYMLVTRTEAACQVRAAGQQTLSATYCSGLLVVERGLHWQSH